MDEFVRELERRYHQSGLTSDLLAWVNALFRGGLYSSFQESFAELSHPDAPPISGYKLTEPPTIFHVIACASPVQLTDEQLQQCVAPPEIVLTFYTITSRPINCIYCDNPGPHTCRDYSGFIGGQVGGQGGHPYLQGVTLPINPDWYGLVPPEQSHYDYNVELNVEGGAELPGALRQWHPSKPRHLGQTYIYTIHKWILRPCPPRAGRSQVLSNGWFVHSLLRVGNFTDSLSLPLRVDSRATGLFRIAITLPDIIRPNNSQAGSLFRTPARCQVITENPNVFPISTEHEKTEEVPYIVIGPCPDFEIIPRGGEVFLPELGQYVPTGITVTVYEESGTLGIVTVPHAVAAYDTSTTCKHGHINGFPLCPPVWSDTGERAAIHCESCARLLPPDHETPKFVITKPGGEIEEKFDPFHICNDCHRRIERQTEDRMAYLQEYLSEPGEGLWYFCQVCEDMADGGYMEDNYCYCFELAEEEGTPPPTLEKRYRCPWCAHPGDYGQIDTYSYNYYQTPQDAIDCCTKIKLWDFSRVIETYYSR